MQHLKFHKSCEVKDKGKACDTLAGLCGLSKSRVKQAMGHGAVWYRRGRGKERRLRRATTMVGPGDRLAIYYDESVMALKPAEARCIEDYNQYSIWFKPAGLLTQGSRYGDHCALTRQVERHFSPKRKAYVVHRIDRETAGLVIMCHNAKAAAGFSAQLQRREIEKFYDVWVSGDLSSYGSSGDIDLPLDGKSAQTRYRLVSFDPQTNASQVSVQLVTGRLHQIRRHFDMIGYPVMGDPRYGIGNKNKSGLMLYATALAYACPLGNGRIEIRITPQGARVS